jgi:lipid-binding SYLF domain-containing protein
MTRFRTCLCTLLTGLALAGSAAVVHAQARQEGRLLISSEVLEELRNVRDQGIPDRLLERAYGIAVIPDMTKVAFLAGGRRGHGVLVVRNKQGRFTDPVFITMTGGSFGWQWGVQQTDIVLVFTTPKGVEGINGGKVTLGADASVAAGPVGRQASAATDATFRSEVYSYSRNRGVFGGISVDGSVLSIDDRANAELYKQPGVKSGDIIAGNVTSDDPAVQRFLAAVSTSTGGAPQRSASAAGVAPPAPTATTAQAAPAAPAPGTAAQAYPLADPQPGQEPK